MYYLYHYYHQSRFKCPAEGLLNEKKLHELARKQLEMEESCIVKVKSVNKKSPQTQKVLDYVRNYKIYILYSLLNKNAII